MIFIQIPGQKFKHKLSKEIREKIEQGEAIGSQYEYSNRNESMKKKTDDSLLTRSRFMHTNVQETRQNDDEENRKGVVDHAEELEALKALVIENEDTISQLEKQLKKLEEKIKKVCSELLKVFFVHLFSLESIFSTKRIVTRLEPKSIN